MKKIIALLLAGFCTTACATNTVPNVFSTMSAGNVAASTLDANFSFLNNNAPTYSAVNYGAKCDGTTDDTAAINLALVTAHSAVGGVVVLPSGTCLETGITMKSGTTLVGQGQTATILKIAGTGNGVTKTAPINSSTAVNTTVANLTIQSTNGGNTGGGYVDVGGSYVTLYNVGVTGFKYGVIFDQTELATISNSNFTSNSTAGIWLVNGADHTAGANKGYTNRITITDNQFNSNYINLLDDGGANHYVANNNFNGGGVSARITGVYGLTIANNEIEGASGNPIYIAETTYAGAYIGPSSAFSIFDNTISGGTCNIYIDQANNGTIFNNTFYQYSTAALCANFGANYRIPAITVANNSKVTRGGGLTALPFFDDLTKWQTQADTTNQFSSTYATSSLSAGVNTVTPASMELISPSTSLFVINLDGSNPELVQVSATTGSTFTATFLAAKASNFIIQGVKGLPSGTYNPTIFGASTAGTIAYSNQYGSWTLNNNRIAVTASATWTTIGAGAGQLNITLPFAVKTGDNVPFAAVMTGSGGIFAGQLYCEVAGGTASAACGYVTAAGGAATGIDIFATGSLTISGTYELY